MTNRRFGSNHGFIEFYFVCDAWTDVRCVRLTVIQYNSEAIFCLENDIEHFCWLKRLFMFHLWNHTIIVAHRKMMMGRIIVMRFFYRCAYARIAKYSTHIFIFIRSGSKHFKAIIVIIAHLSIECRLSLGAHAIFGWIVNIIFFIIGRTIHVK